MKATLLSLLLIGAAPAAIGQSKPNLLIIYADDLGYGDVRCYNPERGKIPTPHLDRLAAEGMRFTDGHSSSGVCSPSRYTLLTGRYHWRSRLQRGIVGTWDDSLIAPDRLTLGGLVREHGYATAMVGKWHLGWNWDIPREKRGLLNSSKSEDVPATEEQKAFWRDLFSREIPGGPVDRGFDRYFGTDVPNWPPFCFIENRRTVGIPSEFLPVRLFKDHLASVQGPSLKDWSLEAILPTLGDRACQWIGEYAKSDKPFLLYLPLTSPHTPLAVNEAWKGKSGLGAYGDLVMETDDLVGRVLAALDAAGIADDTLVFFTSDNGCAAYVGVRELEKAGHFPSGPLRGYKASSWEGGHRVPFIVRWPGRVAPGSICDQLVHQADLFATVAEILGHDLPANAGEDSFSLVPLLKGEDNPIRQHAVSSSIGGAPALRLGSWKYIAHPDKSQPVQLYKLADDLGESRNLAAEMPERVAEMAALLENLITDGRSTPGAKQKNDVRVVRYPAGAPARPKK